MRYVETDETKNETKEPLNLRTQGFKSWKAGVYLALSPKSVAKLKTFLNEHFQSSMPASQLKCDHLSLYRKRSAPNAAYGAFGKIRKMLAKYDWGSIKGTSIRIKELGTEYDECKVLWDASTGE